MTQGLSHKQQRAIRKTAMAARAASMAVGGAGTPRVKRTAAAPPKVEDRDGLLWLIDKGKLSADERRGCEAYRGAYRCPPPGSLRSCIDPTRGNGSGDIIRLDGVAAYVDAQARLERYRSVCLAGDREAIMLMDAVCGGGLTVQAYLGTADSRAVLEALTVLRMGGRLVEAGASRAISNADG